MIEVVVGIGGLLIAFAQLFLQFQERRRAATSESPSSGRSDPATGEAEDLDMKAESREWSPMEGRESPQAWVERKQREAQREHDRAFQEFNARADAQRARTAGSLAILAAALLAVGSVAYVLAANNDTGSGAPAGLVWIAVVLGCVAATLSGLAWLAWRQAGPHSRGAPLALLVVLAGALLALFAILLLSSSTLQ